MVLFCWLDWHDKIKLQKVNVNLGMVSLLKLTHWHIDLNVSTIQDNTDARNIPRRSSKDRVMRVMAPKSRLIIVYLCYRLALCHYECYGIQHTDKMFSCPTE